MSGFRGRVELGSKTEIQLPAGKSYHGVAGSPCMLGITKGTGLFLAPEFVEFCGVSSPAWAEGPARCASSTADRSCFMKPLEKYAFSSHSEIKSPIFRICFGLLEKADALLTKAGRADSSFPANELSWERNLT